MDAKDILEDLKHAISVYGEINNTTELDSNYFKELEKLAVEIDNVKTTNEDYINSIAERYSVNLDINSESKNTFHKSLCKYIKDVVEYKEFATTTNVLFMATEILDHAFTDFLEIAKKAGLDKYKFNQERNRIMKSLAWFRSTYTDSLKTEEMIERYGMTGDLMYEKLKEFYIEL